MNRIMKYAAAALVAATAVSTLGGCEQLEKKAPEDTVAVSFGDTNIMLDEITYMIRSMEYTYESYFGSNICGNDMGDGSGMTVGDYIKQMSLSQLRQTLVLNEYAKKNGRRKVTCVHKANILKMSDGMFLSIFKEIAKEYPEIESDDKIIDNTCMQLVMNPNQFDVMVMQNLYGDILSDLCSGLIGGLGLVPSSNIGSDYAMFEAVHGSAPDIAGKHLANPTAFLWSACMMLEYLGENETASRIRKAVDEVLAEGKHLTRDLHGEASTEEYVDAVIARL